MTSEFPEPAIAPVDARIYRMPLPDSLLPTPQPALREPIPSITCQPENISKLNGVSLVSLQQPVFRLKRAAGVASCRLRRLMASDAHRAFGKAHRRHSPWFRAWRAPASPGNRPARDFRCDSRGSRLAGMRCTPTVPKCGSPGGHPRRPQTP